MEFNEEMYCPLEEYNTLIIVYTLYKLYLFFNFRCRIITKVKVFVFTICGKSSIGVFFKIGIFPKLINKNFIINSVYAQYVIILFVSSA